MLTDISPELDIMWNALIAALERERPIFKEVFNYVSKIN